VRGFDVPMAQWAGADFVAIVIAAGGNSELQVMVDQVVTRSMRMLILDASSSLWTAWVDGFGEIVSLLEQGDRAGAIVRYRRIYPQYKEALKGVFALRQDGDPDAGLVPDGMAGRPPGAATRRGMGRPTRPLARQEDQRTSVNPS
jgi:hypothetical protein